MERSCDNCGNSFLATGKGSAKKRFCCARCKWTWSNANRTLRPNVIASCAVCGNPFERYVSPSAIASGKYTNEYCGRRCKGLALSGDKHPMWKGGRCIVNGYVWIYQPDHPHAKHQGYVLEHRLVMEKKLGRLLDPEEVVHHEDDNTQNNDPGNLFLYPTNADHMREHSRFRIRDERGRLLPKEIPA